MNVVNYAQVWEKELLEIMTQETLCTPFITSNVRWLDAKTFHFTSMAVSGFKPHSRHTKRTSRGNRPGSLLLYAACE